MSALGDYLATKHVTIHTLVVHAIAKLEHDLKTTPMDDAAKEVYKDGIKQYKTMASDIESLSKAEFIAKAP